MEKIVYSTEWTGDMALGEAIINVLSEELKKRGINHRVEKKKGLSDSTDLIIERIGPEDIFLNIVVDEEDIEAATDAFDYVVKERGKDVKEEALKIARRFIKSEEEFEEYSRGIAETYGW